MTVEAVEVVLVVVDVVGENIGDEVVVYFDDGCASDPFNSFFIFSFFSFSFSFFYKPTSIYFVREERA